MMNSVKTEQTEFSRPAWSRGEIVFVFSSITLLLALLIPMPEIVLDILWGFTFCLAGAAIIICLSAQNSSDLRGFVPVVSGLILLRLVVLASSARRIIEEEPMGILINCFGPMMAGSRPLGAVLLCLLLGVICVIVIFMSCQKISAASNNYIDHILPLKKIGLETDFQAGILNETNSQTLFQRIVSEFRFFSGMNGTSVLMRSESVICIFLLLGCLILPIFTEHYQFISGAEFIAKAAPGVLALSLFTLLPALIVAAACGSLMRKEMLTLRVDREQSRPPAKKINLLSSETGAEEEVELLNPEFVEHEDVDKRVVEFEPDSDSPAVSETATLPESETSAIDYNILEMPCQDASEYYETLCNIISDHDSESHMSLLAADKVRSLPVTVAVNAAILLARQQQRVLLVDTDSERNAIAQIFEIEPGSLQQHITPTCLEKLSVCSIPTVELDEFLHNTQATDDFEKVIFYIPDASELNISTHSVSSPPDVFYFDGDPGNLLEQTIITRFHFAGSVRVVRDIHTALQEESLNSAGAAD